MRTGKVVAHAADEETLRAHPAIEPGNLAVPVGKPVTRFYMLTSKRKRARGVVRRRWPKRAQRPKPRFPGHATRDRRKATSSVVF